MTIVMITHDLDSIKDTTDRFLMLKDGKIEFLGNLSELAHNAHTLDSSNVFFSEQERLWREKCKLCAYQGNIFTILIRLVVSYFVVW